MHEINCHVLKHNVYCEKRRGGWMNENQNAVSFGQKLNWLKSIFKVTDGEIGEAVSVSGSLVCRWRKDERILNPEDIIVLKNLADFFATQSKQKNQAHILARALSLEEMAIKKENEDYRVAFVLFMYDNKPIDTVEPATKSSPPSCFFGIDGLLSSLAQLERRISTSSIEITVYLSLEHSRLVRDERVKELWETLYRINGDNPVRLVFDSWDNAEEATKTLRGLLPFMQLGQLRLYLIKSTQKYFYSNISFYAEGIGIIITTEPVSSCGTSISLLVESGDYIKGMGSIFAKFDKNAKAMGKHPLNSRDEANYFGQLFKSNEDLKTVIDGVNLFYMDADAYMKLLKRNGIKGTQRAYRLESFAKNKQQFEVFLETNRMTEIFNLSTFDRMIISKHLKTPDFSFHTGEVEVDYEILKSLFTGMLDYLERYSNLSVYLNRQGLSYTDFSYRLKGDRFVLLHSFENGNTHAVYSDAWLLIYEYIRHFDEALHDGNLITPKDAVQAAIKIRLESLGGSRYEQ